MLGIGAILNAGRMPSFLVFLVLGNLSVEGAAMSTKCLNKYCIEYFALRLRGMEPEEVPLEAIERYCQCVEEAALALDESALAAFHKLAKSGSFSKRTDEFNAQKRAIETLAVISRRNECSKILESNQQLYKMMTELLEEVHY